MGKKIVAIRYYNVWFYLHVNSEQDMVKISYLTDRIDAGEQVIMKDMQITLKRNASSATAELLFHF